MLSKRPSQNYGKINVRTNDTQISLTIDFNAHVRYGYVIASPRLATCQFRSYFYCVCVCLLFLLTVRSTSRWSRSSSS